MKTAPRSEQAGAQGYQIGLRSAEFVSQLVVQGVGGNQPLVVFVVVAGLNPPFRNAM